MMETHSRRAPLARLGLAASLGIVVALSALAGAPADKDVDAEGLALEGYDVVAYFTEGEAVPGKAAYSLTHEGATYRFASAAHREAFADDPERFLPAYGGFCAFGTAMGRKFDGDPEVWKIVDGELYLNINPKVQERWEANIPGFVASADHNWSLIADLPDAELASDAPDGLQLGAAE